MFAGGCCTASIVVVWFRVPADKIGLLIKIPGNERPGVCARDHVLSCSDIGRHTLIKGMVQLTPPSMSTPAFDYYKTLGLTKDASSEDGKWIHASFPILVLNLEQCDAHTSRRC